MLWKHVQLRKDFVFRGIKVNAQGVEALLAQPLFTSDGDSITLAQVVNTNVVLFVFTQSDCAPCLSELTTLGRIGQIRDDMKVYGIMSYANPDEIRQTRQNFSVSFPILQDPNGHILGSLRLPKTPWKIVVNVHSKRIVYEDQPSVTDAEREAFLDRVAQLSSQ
jgi:peroxiredoxin